MDENQVFRYHCKRAYKGTIVDVRDYLIKKVKRDKKALVITCDGLEGEMVINYDEIDKKVHKISAEIQSRIYEKNKYKLYSFIFENNGPWQP